MTDTFNRRPHKRNDRKLTLLKQVYKRSWTCNYAKRYAAGRDITNQSGQAEDNTSVECPFLLTWGEWDSDSWLAAADRILSRVSPFSFWRILTARQTDSARPSTQRLSDYFYFDCESFNDLITFTNPVCSVCN